MGLDVSNQLFGNFHVNWSGTRWFTIWCLDHGLPQPFIGWGGDNSGDPCRLGLRRKHNKLAKTWCVALEEMFPDIATLGKSLLKNPPKSYFKYLYPEPGSFTRKDWEPRVVAGWYALLQHGIKHGDTLQYY